MEERAAEDRWLYCSACDVPAGDDSEGLAGLRRCLLRPVCTGCNSTNVGPQRRAPGPPQPALAAAARPGKYGAPQWCWAARADAGAVTCHAQRR